MRMTAHRGRARLLAAIAATLLVLIALGWATLPWLLARLGERALATRGLSDIRLEIGYPGWNQLNVARLEFSGTATGQRYRLAARDLVLDYDLARLRAGRIARLRVSQATLRLGARADRPDAAVPAAPFAPEQWIDAVPLERIVVDRLVIEAPDAGAPLPRAVLAGEARREADGINSRWTLGDGTRNLLHADLTRAAPGKLRVLVYPPAAPDRPALAVTAAKEPSADHPEALRGTIDVQLGPLEALLGRALPPGYTPLGGRVRAEWTLARTSGAETLEGALALDATDLRAGAVLRDGALRLETSVAGTAQNLHWRVRNNLHLAARLDPARLAIGPPAAGRPPDPAPEPLVLRAPRGLSGTWNAAPGGAHLALAAGAEFLLAKIHTPDAHLPELRLVLPAGVRLTRTASGGWRSAEFDLTLAAPTIDTRLAALGRLEDLALHARIGPGSPPSLPALTVRTAAVALLGGRVSANDIGFGAGRRFALELEGVDLARLVALERQQEIEASGRIGGSLPVVFTSGGVRIDNGHLRASPPGGTIRYRASESVRSMAETNPNLGLVLQALSHYRYDTLEAGVNYAENGDLVLAVAMTGRNPNWNDRQAIHLNINVEENVPLLLRSLRLAGDVSGEVERRVRERTPAAR